MREIKFRAWDKLNKKFVKISDLIFDDDGSILEIGTEYLDFGDLGNSTASFDFIELMQYTGLKDKKGVEIYEGDYVNVTGEGEHLFSSEVKWFGDRGYPAFDIEAPNSFYFDSNVLSCISNVSEYEIEVIGNKFDNPELLNKGDM